MRYLTATTSLAWIVLAGLGSLAATPQSAAAGGAVSLAGSWRFQLDPGDAGLEQRWFDRDLEQRVHLPGALQNQGFGDDITVDTKWTGEVGTDRWKRGAQYAKYRQPGNIKIPFFLQPEKHYVGAAWFQRDIEIPKSWAGQRIVLTLERPHWGTHVWLDGRLVGTNDSLSTPHVYDLGTGLAPGKRRLTIRVDNRILVEVGDWSHSVSDHTQGNWNGIVGKIELSATSPVWVEDVQVFPDLAKGIIEVTGEVRSSDKAPGTGQAVFEIEDLRTGRKLPFLTLTKNPTVQWSNGTGGFRFTHSLRHFTNAWDEFKPQLYRVTVVLDGFTAARSATFGLREITAQGRQFLLNGRPAFFRGTLECCIFPKTGYPPTDVESWKRIVRVCKAHGLNHIRFHSWCPPDAAFVAADELGFYYQVECGVWTQPGNGKAIDQWLYKESERIVRAYGNHPSFVLLTHGNEPHGPNREKYLAQWVNYWKRDGRFLVTSGSAYPQLPENQYHVYYPCRGPHGWLGKDYRKDVATLDVPVIVHEMGQWCVYPNFDEIKKYSGPLKAKNFEIFRDSLKEHGMLDQWRDFLHASGKLQVLCYKEEIEAAMRTPGIGGHQLLDLHDFPGQGTALVGVLDPFWDSKGYVTPAEFRRFSGPVVPLARLLRRTWTTDETLTAEVEIANFGPGPLANAQVGWKLVGTDGKAVASGAFPDRALPLGKDLPLGQINIDLAKVAAPGAYRLVVTGGQPSRLSGNRRDAGPAFENDWGVWVYPAVTGGEKPSDALVTSSLDENALARLAAGGSVVLTPAKLTSEHPRLGFEPIFWNRYMFNTQGRQTLGLLCDPKHPALAQFPTDFFQDWQWSDIVSRAQGMVLDDLPRSLRPIVQVIDDWNTNRKLGLVFECRVGPGKLLVCAADLTTGLDKRPATRQLRQSLLAYAGSGRFKPKVEVTRDDLTKTLELAKPSKLVRLGAKVIEADSEDREHGNVAAHAIDGDPDTLWHTRWQPRNDPIPHFLVIDLGQEVTLVGITYLPRQEQANGRIAQAEVFCSNDPKTWGEPVIRATWPNSSQLQTLTFHQPARARYLKLVARSEVNGNPFASIAELDVLTDGK
jgi:beta-galactosidase